VARGGQPVAPEFAAVAAEEQPNGQPVAPVELEFAEAEPLDGQPAVPVERVQSFPGRHSSFDPLSWEPDQTLAPPTS